jgi:hypothetical protein
MENDIIFDIIKDYKVDLISKQLNEYSQIIENITLDLKEKMLTDIDTNIIAKKEYDLFYQIDIDISEFDASGEDYPYSWLELRQERIVNLIEKIKSNNFEF